MLREARKKYSEVTRRDVTEYLNTEIAYVMHKPMRRKFPTRQIIAKTIDHLWQSDLGFMISLKRNNSFNVAFILVIDCLSCFIIGLLPLKSKSTKHVTEALEKIFAATDRRPTHFQSDGGMEYWGKETQTFFRERGINQFSVTTPQKASISERYIREIKLKLSRHMTATQTFRWIDVLEDIRQSLNNKIHRVIGQSPASVTTANQTAVFQKKHKNHKFKFKFKFKIGDFCRVNQANRAFRKESAHTYSRLKYMIRQVIPSSPHMYLLKLPGTDDNISRGYYSPELTADKTNIDFIPKAFPVLKRVI